MFLIHPRIKKVNGSSLRARHRFTYVLIMYLKNIVFFFHLWYNNSCRELCREFSNIFKEGDSLLSDSPLLKSVRSGKNRPKGAVTSIRYSDRQKIEAVTTFLMLGGNVIMTCATLGIPEYTIYQWKKTEWWNTMVNDLKHEERLVLSSKLKKVMEKSWEVVGDRLEYGDWQLNQKTGELVRKPVSMRDAAKVATDSIMIREKLDMNESFTIHADQIEDKLSKLAKAFSDLAKGVVHETPVEDIEYVERVDLDLQENTNALDDREEWQDGEGLQKRESFVQLETGTKEES